MIEIVCFETVYSLDFEISTDLCVLENKLSKATLYMLITRFL